MMVMDKYMNKGDKCTKLDNPCLFADMNRGERKFYFYTEKYS